jgi:peptidoglycan/LPS O-acetylase OafA/YrhL
MRRFDALDGLRAIAAVIVVFFHFGGPSTGFLSGWIGVHIFFVVSGFLITTRMLRERDRTGRISLRNFYLRRIFRIMPLYYFALALTVASAYHQGKAWLILKGHLVEYLTFMNEYHLKAGTPFIQSWTLGIEQKFYLLWPLALVLAGALSARLQIPACIAAIVLVLLPWNSYLASSGIHYSVLLIGALLALVLHSARGFALLSPLTHPVAGAVLLVGVVCLHLSIPDLFAHFHSELPAIFLYGLAIALLIPSLLGPGVGRALLTLRPLVFVGERSYGLYLFQFLAGTLAAALFPRIHEPPLEAVLVALTSLAMADLTHRRLEQPMIQVGRSLIRRLGGSAATTPAPREPLPEQSTPDAVGLARAGQ